MRLSQVVVFDKCAFQLFVSGDTMRFVDHRQNVGSFVDPGRHVKEGRRSTTKPCPLLRRYRLPRLGIPASASSRPDGTKVQSISCAYSGIRPCTVFCSVGRAGANSHGFLRSDTISHSCLDVGDCFLYSVNLCQQMVNFICENFYN